MKKLSIGILASKVGAVDALHVTALDYMLG
jgi:hypothetical protein